MVYKIKKLTNTMFVSYLFNGAGDGNRTHVVSLEG